MAWDPQCTFICYLPKVAMETDFFTNCLGKFDIFNKMLWSMADGFVLFGVIASGTVLLENQLKEGLMQLLFDKYSRLIITFKLYHH